MNNHRPTTKKVVQLTLLSCMLTTAISACSSGNGSSSSGENNTDNGDVRSLQIITPKTIYSKPSVAGSSYVVINNPTNTAVKNVQYSLSNQIGSGAGAQIESTSAANCATVAAYSQCNIKVTVPAGAVAGSLGLNISNDSSLLTKLSKAVKAATRTPTMGVEQAAYNTVSGADGITLSYYHTVINGTPYVLVSGLVASANAGTFNKIVLVNGNGTELPNQVALGSVNNTQGSTFNILLPVPSGANATQTIKVQTQQTTGETTVVSTSTSSSTLTTTQNIGIVEMLPSAVYLTKANPEQIITFDNTGDAIAQLHQVLSNNQNVEVVFSPTSLSTGTTSTATLKLKNTAVAATTGNITLTYNNGQSEAVTSGSVDQNVNPTPSPGPTPTPPAPSPTPTAGLTAVLNPDNDFFKTSAGAAVSRQLTLTNTGNTDENAIVLTLPSGFTISNGQSNTCQLNKQPAPKLQLSSGTVTIIGNTLTPGGATGSCTVTVTYTNSTETPLASENISIAYDYNNGTAALTPTVAAVNYKVTQSTANLSVSASPSPANYGSIVNDNTATTSPITYTVTNSGDETATSLAFNFAGTDGALFHYTARSPALLGECTSSLSSANGSNVCTIRSSTTTFGPAVNGTPVGTKTANFDIAYTPYTGGNTAYASIDVSGNVTQAPSATFSSNVTANTFTGGAGTQGNQYTGYTGTAYTISVTYTNTSSIAATGFTTDYQNPPTNWTMTTHGCNSANMPASTGTCVDIYTLSNAAPAGTTSINLANVNGTWTDSSGTQSPQAISGQTKYANLTVSPPPPPPPLPLLITIIDLVGSTSASMMGATPVTFKAIIISGVGGSTVTASLANSVTGTVVSDPSPCALTTAGTSNCTFSIIPWYTGFNNSTVGVANYDPFTPTETEITLSATNGANITGAGVSYNKISYSITTPYVYLPAPEEGAASATNTGITWGSSGTVATRFEAGSQSGGGTCSDSLKDNLTGLEWIKAPTSDIYTWAAAKIAPAIPATLCGYTDWRLPTVSELKSLVNYAATQSGSTPTAWLISQGFTNVQALSYWSSTAYSGSNAWAVAFNNGNSAYYGTDLSTTVVWPVRGGQ